MHNGNPFDYDFARSGFLLGESLRLMRSAVAPLVSTMNSGLSREAATLCPLICKGFVTFFTTVPSAWPPWLFHDT